MTDGLGNLKDLLPDRSIEDILAGRVRVTLGSTEYVLPEPSIEETDLWLASLEGDLTGLLGSIARGGNDGTVILAALRGQSDRLLAFLESYDSTGVLPDRETIRKIARPAELIRAVMSVWVAANPLVGAALAGLASMPTGGTSPGSTSSLPPSTDGPLDGSDGS